MTDPPAPAAIRAELLDRLRPPTVAWSVDGRDLQFVTGFDHAIRPGGFATVNTPDGVRYLAQVHHLGAQANTGIDVEVDTAALGLSSAVTAASVTLTGRVVAGSGVVLCRLDDGPAEGFVDADIEPADDAVVEAYFESTVAADSIEIGTIRGTEVAARLRSAGFARHTFLCGQSGSGKTFSLGVVLERILLETDLPIVVIDPNSDYVNLGRVTTRAAVNRFRRTEMTADDYDALADRYQRRAQVVVASASGGDLPLRIHLSDLTLDEQALAMQLDPIADLHEYGALADAVAALAGRPYHVDDLLVVLDEDDTETNRLLAQRIRNLRIAEWSVWASPDETSLAESGVGHRALILDTGSLADAGERSVVALAVLGRLRRRPLRAPISVVIDEAHHVCPPTARTPIERAVADLALWIAGEGRKYGIYLLLSTQRPQKLHRNVLSQCDNLLLMRVNSVGDLDQIAEVFSHVPDALIAQARAHRMGEMLAAGPIAPTPLRLQVGVRWTEEGGADLPSDWTTPSDRPIVSDATTPC